jgi:hypothetical protein
MVDCEDGALLVMRGTGIEELRVPVLARPGALAFRTEKGCGVGAGQVHDDIECGLSSQELGRWRG